MEKESFKIKRRQCIGGDKQQNKVMRKRSATLVLCTRKEKECLEISKRRHGGLVKQQIKGMQMRR